MLKQKMNRYKMGPNKFLGYKLVLIFLVLILSSCSVTYKFEADQKRYSDYFPTERPDGITFKSEMKFHNNYLGNANSLSSIYFPDKKSNTWINIEHLVKCVDYDVDILPEVKDRNYMFSAIEFHRDLKICNVKIEHYYKGKPLEKFHTYIYTYPRNKDNSINHNEYFNVKKVDSSIVDEDNQFIYVTIYKMPISKMMMRILPRFLWFRKGMKEKIEIEYIEDGEKKIKKYEFELKWKRREHWVT